MFDQSGRLQFNPKDCEHKRRYGGSKDSDKEHTHVTLTPQSLIPKPWREYLGCRQCKRSIVEALGWTYLCTAKHLRGSQVFAGCLSGDSQDNAWIITRSIWRHAVPSMSSYALLTLCLQYRTCDDPTKQAHCKLILTSY